MLRLHVIAAEVEWPRSQVHVFRSRDAEGLVNTDTVDGGIICMVGRFEFLSSIVDLEHNSVLRTHID